MPRYDYKCLNCNKIVEFKLPIEHIPPLHFSDNCEAQLMKKQVCITSFSLKGNGWYKDGYSKHLKSKTRNMQDNISELKSNLEDTKKEFKETANKIE